ncbi:MAG: ATP-binding protein [Rhodobacterales bacterium]|nr:MAG: ATP-binding protein [Rhodobacterales bacterium]
MLDIQNLRRLMVGPLSLTLQDGECAALGGASGAIGSGARDQMSATEWRKRVALLPANSGWWLDRVRGHFQNPEAIRGQLDQLDLPPQILDWRVNRLSTGEKHRLALLRCLENAPEVLLMDEPTAALDPDTTLKVEALLKQQLANGVSVLLITHDQQQPRRIAHRLLHLQDGQIHEAAP